MIILSIRKPRELFDVKRNLYFMWPHNMPHVKSRQKLVQLGLWTDNAENVWAWKRKVGTDS